MKINQIFFVLLKSRILIELKVDNNHFISFNISKRMIIIFFGFMRSIIERGHLRTMTKDFEILIKILKSIENDPEKSQRDIAQELGISIGKVNYILKELTLKGTVKTKRFINSRNKLGYKYILTPEGIKQKLILTRDFIGRKIKEYEELMK